MVWKTFPVPGVRLFFPPELVRQVKALACELPHQHGLNMGPLSALGAPGRACEGFLTDGRSHRSQENFADLELLTKVIRKDIRS